MRREVTTASGILPNIIMLKPICPWERNTWAGVPQLASLLIKRFGAESPAGRCDHLRIVKRLEEKLTSTHKSSSIKLEKDQKPGRLRRHRSCQWASRVTCLIYEWM